jgi:hypothetical protein
MMRRLASQLRIGLAAAVLAWLATACLTPSVPLPPPLLGQMTFAAGATAGQVTLQSPPQANTIGAARFTVYNASKQMGVIFESASDGSFTSPPFPGSDGDYIQLSYDKTTGSGSRCTTLHLTGAPIGDANTSDCH